MAIIDRDAAILSSQRMSLSRRSILRGSSKCNRDVEVFVSGKKLCELQSILTGKFHADISSLLYASEAEQYEYIFEEKEVSSFSLNSTISNIFNRITVKYCYNFNQPRYRKTITKRNPLSENEYGIRERTFQLQMIASTRTANKLADAFLKSFSTPTMKASFSHSLRSIYLEVGDRVKLVHSVIPTSGTMTGIIVRRNIIEAQIGYTVLCQPYNDQMYSSELVRMTDASEAHQGSISIAYEKGVATITVYADVEGYPPVEGANVTIGGITKDTNSKGQVRFSLLPGNYIASIVASGYEEAKIEFTV